MNDNIYGQLQSEKMATDSHAARSIVKEIDNFGINDRQRWLIIYYLSLGLESIEEMKSLTSFIKEVKGDDLFISLKYDADETKEK